MSDVVLQHVAKDFSCDIHALRDVNLEIASGEYFVVVGPSGSGKSTLLRLIAGLDAPTAGDVLIAGRRVNGVPPAERGVALVFQSAALYPHLSVRANLAFGLTLLRLDAHEVHARIARAAEMLAIVPLLDRLPSELSGGERQRVAIGRAVVRRPRVLLLDEPLSNLDVPLSGELRWQLDQLRVELGATVIHVTHDQGEAMALGGRVCVICNGKVQQVAPPRVIYDRPANAFVAAFFGAPGMNLIVGRICGRTFLIRHGGGETQIDLPAEALSSRALPDGPTLLGVRPEDLQINGLAACFPTVCIERVEELGRETIAYFELAGTRHAVRLPDTGNLIQGQPLKLCLASDRWHWFRFTDGARLN